jgi:type II secretory pathway pseudopilin PulG
MYRIIGGDGKEYGPLSAEQIQQWIREGRVDARTMAMREGDTEWTSVGEIPELMGVKGRSQTDGKAIASMVCGILSLGCAPVLASIPAIILGHISRSAIQKSLGNLKGEGMALAGLIMGYISLVFPVILIIATIAIPSLLRSRQAANESAAIANLRTINTAEVSYLATNNGRYGNLEELIDAGLLDTRFRSDVSGYKFTIEASAAEYVAEATPNSPNTGRFAYFSKEDGVVRYSLDQSYAPSASLAGQPVQ